MFKVLKLFSFWLLWFTDVATIAKKIYDKNRVNRYIIKIYLIFFHIIYWIVVNYMEYPRALRVFNAYMYMEYIIKVALDFK